MSNAMKDGNVLFSRPMILALLDGSKSQTRRLLKPQATDVIGYGWNGAKGATWTDQDGETRRLKLWAGQRVWVREAWRPGYGAEGYREDLGRVAQPKDFDPKTTAIEYLADDTYELNGKNRPGIHMCRWMSRITLTITDVRVERLQEITEADAIAEGIEKVFYGGDDPQYVGRFGWKDYRDHPHAIAPYLSPMKSYETLWEKINGEGSWAASPWIVAYTFDVRLSNIDATETA